MPGKSKKGGGLETTGYAMQMGSHSKVCPSTFKQKDKDNVEKAAGRKPFVSRPPPFLLPPGIISIFYIFF